MSTDSRPIVAIGEVLFDLFDDGPRLGGAPLNFAFHCRQLGHPAAIVSAVGNDELGRTLRAEVTRLGLSDEFIRTVPTHATGSVKVERDANGQPKYAIREDVAWDHIRWVPQLADLVKSARAVCFGTLAQRMPESRQTIRRFVREAPADATIVLDLNLRPPFDDEEVIADSVRLADWLKVSGEEAIEVLNAVQMTVPQFPPGGRFWQATLPNLLRSRTGVFAVTRGEHGCAVGNRSSVFEFAAHPIAVADPVGAGDAFTAALLTQTLDGASLAEAARFANAYAAIVASKPGGTCVVARAEVERLH